MTTTNIHDTHGIAEALAAGAKTTNLSDRTASIAVTVRGVKTDVPVYVGAAGDVKVIRDAIELAEAQADHQNPIRGGRYRFDDLTSIMAWTDRYMTSNTNAYLTPPGSSAGKLAIEIDDLPVDIGGTNRRIGASLSIELHDRLKIWKNGQNTWSKAEVFCTFIDMAGTELDTADVISMTKNLEIKSDSLWKRTIDDKGTVRVQTEDQQGPATRIPREFSFSVPVFDSDDEGNVCQFKARLFMRLVDGRPQFMYQIDDLRKTIAQAMITIRDEVAKHIPISQVYFGQAPT